MTTFSGEYSTIAPEFYQEVSMCHKVLDNLAPLFKMISHSLIILILFGVVRNQVCVFIIIWHGEADDSVASLHTGPSNMEKHATAYHHSVFVLGQVTTMRHLTSSYSYVFRQVTCASIRVQGVLMFARFPSTPVAPFTNMV